MPAKKYISKIVKGNDNIFIKDTEAQESLFYYDIYIGAATQSTTIKTSTYHHDAVLRGKPISITASSQKIWLIFPDESEVPTVQMNGIEVPKELHGTTTINEATYKVYKSLSYYTGTFNVCLM